MARAGEWPAVFDELMREHYDPLYERSMKRNFSGLDTAAVVQLADGEPAALERAARELLAQ
jgi:tRNA 2-selenouridine synthase